MPDTMDDTAYAALVAQHRWVRDAAAAAEAELATDLPDVDRGDLTEQARALKMLGLVLNRRVLRHLR